jgi:hypothetical protein
MQPRFLGNNDLALGRVIENHSMVGVNVDLGPVQTAMASYNNIAHITLLHADAIPRAGKHTTHV